MGNIKSDSYLSCRSTALTSPSFLSPISSTQNVLFPLSPSLGHDLLLVVSQFSPIYPLWLRDNEGARSERNCPIPPFQILASSLNFFCPFYIIGIAMPWVPIQLVLKNRLKNHLKNHLRSKFDSVTCLNYPFLVFSQYTKSQVVCFSSGFSSSFSSGF